MIRRAARLTLPCFFPPGACRLFGRRLGISRLAGSAGSAAAAVAATQTATAQQRRAVDAVGPVLRSPRPNDTVAVNRYLWNASLEVLNFLPIQSVDPFTGVIVTGYGTPPAAAARIAPPSRSATRRWTRAR